MLLLEVYTEREALLLLMYQYIPFAFVANSLWEGLFGALPLVVIWVFVAQIIRRIELLHLDEGQ